MEVTLNLMPYRLDLRLKLSEVRKKTKLQHLTPNFSPGLTLIELLVACHPKPWRRKATPGLTLIELLVVIAILGILASFTSVAMIGQQKKARDAQRISDLAQIKNALQSVKNDCKAAAYYPTFVPAPVTEANQFSDATQSVNSLMGYLSDADLKYISSIFKDPKNSGSYVYKYAFGTTTPTACPNTATPPVLGVAGSSDFILRVVLEDTKNPALKTSYAKCSPKFTTITLNPVSADSPIDGIDDDFYYYECND